MQTWVDLKFADGEYTFKLGIGQIAEIERKCDAGIGAIYARVMRGRYGLGVDEIMPVDAEYRFAEMIEVVRQGLIGGGGGVVDGNGVRVTSIRANELLERYVYGNGFDRQALRETWALTAAILGALIEGYDPPKKAEPGESPAT